jgi:hypothetical protein
MARWTFALDESGRYEGELMREGAEPVALVPAATERSAVGSGWRVSGYGTERLRSRLACNFSYVNEGLGAFVRSRACQSAVARSTAGTGFAPG